MGGTAGMKQRIKSVCARKSPLGTFVVRVAAANGVRNEGDSRKRLLYTKDKRA